jgi:hypothetical protein
MKTIKITLAILLISSASMAQNSNSLTYVCSADASIYQGDNVRNYGSELKLSVKNKKGSTVSRRSLLQFDLSSQETKTFTKAVLKFYVNNLEAAEGSSANSLIIDISSIENTWKESEVNWKTAPKPALKIASIQVENKKTWYEVDLTDYIKGLISSEKVFSLILTNIEGNGTLAELNSKEGKNKPSLILQ